MPTLLTTYVPTKAIVFPDISKGSGIVASLQKGSEGLLRVDYEGNLYDAENLRTWPERVHHAAGRHISNYPTAARRWHQPQTLEAVGAYDADNFRIELNPDTLATLQAWAGPNVVREVETYNLRRAQIRQDCSRFRFLWDPPEHRCELHGTETSLRRCLACRAYDGIGPDTLRAP